MTKTGKYHRCEKIVTTMKKCSVVNKMDKEDTPKLRQILYIKQKGEQDIIKVQTRMKDEEKMVKYLPSWRGVDRIGGVEESRIYKIPDSKERKKTKKLA